ncbi:hypothetical protein [Clostridium psychrophilum]|uniref:hypothetical protein n=1 Tax=Clostridium psychrophilum TaxID=132926 RepID=UPI001C0CC273|nr:hypothetical protein [Clostridium psychrophilum]MBU3181428.1 hypothetical protein [Clostridium psychrophilum]
MSYDRWREILTNNKEDTILMSLKVTNPKNQIKTKTVNGEVHKIGGIRAACFVDKSGGALLYLEELVALTNGMLMVKGVISQRLFNKRKL